MKPWLDAGLLSRHRSLAFKVRWVNSLHRSGGGENSEAALKGLELSE